MATTIKLKNSVTATNAPSSLVQGEVAINVTDKKVWVGNAATTPIQLLGGGADGSFTNISVSSVATFGAGTVSAPSITTTGDTNTGIFFPAADTIAFTEGGAEAMRIDSSGNVGIGTSSPSYPLQVVKNANGAQRVLFSNNSSGSTAETAVAVSNGTAEGSIRVAGTSYGGYGAYTANNTLIYNDTSAITIMADNATNGIIKFATGSNTERMRITSGGSLLVGTTTTRGEISLDFNGSTAAGVTINDTASAASSLYMGFYIGGTLIGNISRVASTSAVAYATTSDQRLKSNIADANPVLNKLMDVKVRQFDWTEGDLHQDAGFIAQELAPVLSGIVIEGKTEKDMWQLDYARLTPYLVKAIQEQQTLIENLTTRLNALEGK